MEFLDLNGDVLREIERYLIAPRDRRQFLLTCRHVYRALTDVRLWGNISPTDPQNQALAFLRAHHTSYLNLPMSMGKTAVGLRLAMEETGIGFALRPNECTDKTRGTIIIIAPKILWDEVWMREIGLMCRDVDEKTIMHISRQKNTVGVTPEALIGKILFLGSGSKVGVEAFVANIVPLLSTRVCVLIDEVQKASLVLSLLYPIRDVFCRIVMMSADVPRHEGNFCNVLRWGPVTLRPSRHPRRRPTSCVDPVPIPIYSVPHSEISAFVPNLHVSLEDFAFPWRELCFHSHDYCSFTNFESILESETKELGGALETHDYEVKKDVQKLLRILNVTGKLVLVGDYGGTAKRNRLFRYVREVKYYTCDGNGHVKFFYDLYVLFALNEPLFLYPEEKEKFLAAERGVLVCSISNVTGVDLSFASQVAFFVPSYISLALYHQVLGRFTRTTSPHKDIHITLFAESRFSTSKRLLTVNINTIKSFCEKFNVKERHLRTTNGYFFDVFSVSDEVFLGIIVRSSCRQYKAIINWVSEISGISNDKLLEMRRFY